MKKLWRDYDCLRFNLKNEQNRVNLQIDGCFHSLNKFGSGGASATLQIEGFYSFNNARSKNTYRDFFYTVTVFSGLKKFEPGVRLKKHFRSGLESYLMKVLRIS